MKIKNFKTYLLLKYFSLALVFVILSQAEISNLSPFLFAVFFAGLYVGLDEKIISGVTLISVLFQSQQLESFLTGLTVVAVGLVVFYVHKFAKRKIRLVTIFVSFLFSNVTYVYYNYLNLEKVILFILLGLITLFVYITVLQIMLLRKNCFKLTLDESICFLFAISTIGLGVAPIFIFDFPLSKFLLSAVLLICVGIGSPSMTYSIILAFSLGVALFDLNLMCVAEYAVLSMIASIFSMPAKIKIAFMVLIGDFFVQYCFISQNFNVYTLILPTFSAILLFLLLPNKILTSLSDLIYVKKSEMTSRNAINTTRKNLKKRMFELSNVFLDMKHIHLGMTKKELSKEELILMLTKEVMATCCKDCLDKNRCTRSLGTDNKSNLELLVEIAVTKGKVTLLDIPSGLSNRCVKVNNLIGLINRVCEEYRQYKSIMADVNNVKILMADQMGAVSKLLIDIGEEIDTNVRFDIVRENKIISRLLNQNIQCKEVLIYNEKNNEISAVLAVKSENFYQPIIEKVVTETLKVPMQITNISPLEETGFNSIQLKKKNKYDCVFGLASCNKSGNEKCGDCHSIIRLSSNRFLLALCDGMGAGSEAHKTSSMTLGLIENFYKVGFDNDIILESVNKLLAINNQETYSTLDICVLDLDREISDFIKVGAPAGFIKRETNIEIVEGSSLPIGALENISPTTYKTTISSKDIIIMATDGIVDAFDSYERMIDFVGGLATNNPQTIAEAILNEALALNDMSAKDDMTVLVARTYLKT